MYWIIEKGHYIDSLESLFATTVLNEQPGIQRALVGMATEPAKLILKDVGLVNEELLACNDADYVIVAEADSREAFDTAVDEMRRVMKQNNAVEAEESYPTVADAVAAQAGMEQGEERIFALLDQAQALLDTPGVPRDGYYAFVCEKCAPAFEYYGYFLAAQDLKERAKRIYERA